MNFSVGDKQLSAGELFRLVWRGWFVGATITFIPILLVMDQLVHDGKLWSDFPLVLLVGIPIINALQGGLGDVVD